jgi:hypothetical protein
MLECIPETIHGKEILGLWADLRWYKHCVLIAIHVKHAAVSAVPAALIGFPS